jgi:pimeloyl-ACP methyl ester carboxylesterase
MVDTWLADMARMHAVTVAGKRFEHHFISYGPPASLGQIPLLMLHGFLGDMFSWQYCMVPLSRHGRVFSVDLPCHGQSKNVWDGEIDGMIEWLEDVMDALDMSKCHLVAHSFGAWVALQAALRFSHRIVSLSLVACAGIDKNFNISLLRSALNLDNEHISIEFAKALTGQTSAITYQLASHHKKQLLNSQRLDNLKNMLESMIHSTKLIVNLSSLTVPLHFLWSCNDNILPLPPRNIFPPQALISINDYGGHIPHILLPGWVTQEINQFLFSSLVKKS